jgi:hypothetical protein
MPFLYFPFFVFSILSFASHGMERQGMSCKGNERNGKARKGMKLHGKESQGMT